MEKDKTRLTRKLNKVRTTTIELLVVVCAFLIVAAATFQLMSYPKSPLSYQQDYPNE